MRTEGSRGAGSSDSEFAWEEHGGLGGLALAALAALVGREPVDT